MAEWLKYVIVIAVSYLVGSVSFGRVIAKIGHGPDLRTVGSGNTGTTNVIRAMGKKAGYITFALDFLKAILSCALGAMLLGNHGDIPFGAMIGGFAAVIGHNFPVYYGFKGGKGVCSSMAVMLFCFPIQALICFVAGFAVMFITKYVSAGSIVGAVVVYIGLVITHFNDPFTLIWGLIMIGLLIWRHKANIQRIMNGTENKIGQKKK